MSSDDNRKDEPTDRHAPTIVGWAARLVSLAILALLAGTIAWKIAYADTTVHFAAEVVAKDIAKMGGRWQIPVEITNQGDRSARSVALEVEVAGETSDVELDLIGPHETQRFVVVRDQPSTDVTLTTDSFIRD